jgi:hypothetical protein
VAEINLDARTELERLRADGAPDQDPGPSFWVSDEPDLNPTRWHWGCEQCPEDAAGGTESTRRAAFNAALGHERKAHAGG